MARFGFPEAPVDLEVRVDEPDRPRRVRWTCREEWPQWAGTTITRELSPGPKGGTMVMLRHEGLADDYPDPSSPGSTSCGARSWSG